MKFILGFLLVLLVGCNKNPYPDKGIISVTQPAEPEDVRPAISVDIPDNVELKEGSEGQVTIRAVVPKPGVPVITFEKLPEGAVWDPATMTLSWKPGFEMGNAPNDPQVKVMVYPVVVWVRSSQDEVQAVRKSMNLIVHDTPRPITINSANDFEAIEGDTARFNFSIVNQDYPRGPFDVSLGDFPVNSEIEKINNTDYRVRLTPDHQHVNVLRDTSCWSSRGACREYKTRLVVINPAGHKFEKKVTIKIIDKRIAPKVVAPDNLEQGLDVNFQVGAYDLNSEVTPNIEMTSRAPTIGQFSIDHVRDTNGNSTVARISWLDLPPSMNGTTQTFSFRSCVNDGSRRMQNCVSRDVRVRIRVRERLAPIIDRRSWTVGEMKYLNFNESQQFKIDVVDAQERNLAPVVEIFPESVRKHVSWANNTLRVRFNETGIFQFNLTATSQYGVKSIESFVVEVFPESRGQVLMLSDSSRDNEVKFYRRQFKNIDIVNPFLQDLGKRLLAGRRTLIVGTSVLADVESKAKVQEAADVIPNLVVASPLLQNLPDALYRQIIEDYRISVVGRYEDIPRLPALKDMDFVTRLDFEAPKSPVRLAGKATSESSNPLIFSTGVDTNNCDDVLEIADRQRLTRLKLGIICDRPKSGRLVLLGTEWADLKASEEDAAIPSKWLNTMLTAGLNLDEELP